jgi:hypothetical protein
VVPDLQLVPRENSWMKAATQVKNWKYISVYIHKRSFQEELMGLVLLMVPATQTEVQVSLGRLLAAVITTLGPELAATATHRTDILTAAGVLVQAESLACLQQLHMSAPAHLDLAAVVPDTASPDAATCAVCSTRTVWLCTCPSVLSLAVTAPQEDLASRMRANVKELFPANQAV